MITALRSCTPTLVVSCGKPVFLGWRRPTAGHGLSRAPRGGEVTTMESPATEFPMVDDAPCDP